jgi:hypothetical protein
VQLTINSRKTLLRALPSNLQWAEVLQLQQLSML